MTPPSGGRQRRAGAGDQAAGQRPGGRDRDPLTQDARTASSAPSTDAGRAAPRRRPRPGRPATGRRPGPSSTATGSASRSRRRRQRATAGPRSRGSARRERAADGVAVVGELHDRPARAAGGGCAGRSRRRPPPRRGRHARPGTPGGARPGERRPPGEAQDDPAVGARRPRAGAPRAGRSGRRANTSRMVALNWRSEPKPAAKATSVTGRSVVSSRSRATWARCARASASGPGAEVGQQVPPHLPLAVAEVAGEAGDALALDDPVGDQAHRPAGEVGREVPRRASRGRRRGCSACRPGSPPPGRPRPSGRSGRAPGGACRRAARPAVDPGGRDGGEEPAVEAGVAALHGAVAAGEVEVEGSCPQDRTARRPVLAGFGHRERGRGAGRRARPPCRAGEKAPRHRTNPGRARRPAGVQEEGRYLVRTVPRRRPKARPTPRMARATRPTTRTGLVPAGAGTRWRCRGACRRP